ncbi:unnamed protein product [Peniophora sp. CBMAI 1063]|nr:unnamed protein product [Peniophora sp. CBMAI 1063]
MSEVSSKFRKEAGNAEIVKSIGNRPLREQGLSEGSRRQLDLAKAHGRVIFREVMGFISLLESLSPDSGRWASAVGEAWRHEELRMVILNFVDRVRTREIGFRLSQTTFCGDDDGWGEFRHECAVRGLGQMRRLLEEGVPILRHAIQHRNILLLR